jgi:hypothetical protein
MHAVYDQEFYFGSCNRPRPARRQWHRAELLRRKEQDGARNRGLGDGRFVKNSEWSGPPTSKRRVETLFAALDARDELRPSSSAGTSIGFDAAFLV